VDLALYKNIKFSQRVKAQLRFEVFNVFNRVNFVGVSTNLSPTSVTTNTGSAATATTITSFNTLPAATNYGGPLPGINEWSLLSGLARLQYSYKEKYLLSGAIRADGYEREFGDKLAPRGANIGKFSGEGYLISTGAHGYGLAQTIGSRVEYVHFIGRRVNRETKTTSAVVSRPSVPCWPNRS